MWKRKLTKLLALALSILMAAGTLTDWLPAVLAAEPSGSPAVQEETGGGGGEEAPDIGGFTEVTDAQKLQFQNGDNGRPNLYVDFLGDNRAYRSDGTVSGDAEGLFAPAGYDKSLVTNPESVHKAADGVQNYWRGYTAMDLDTPDERDHTIFWVGVGIDRTELLELLHSGDEKVGLASFEAGFYYNNVYVEPYVGADGYAATIARANGLLLPDGTAPAAADGAYPANTQWSGAYKLLHAVAGLQPQVDLITQETIQAPSIQNILDNTYAVGGTGGSGTSEKPDWRMTYISLELGDPDGADQTLRLQDRYTGVQTVQVGEGDEAVQTPVTPYDALHGGSETEYLLLIPFRVKAYDADQRYCLRLVRNATHFSIGAGTQGTEPYAAWDRVTVRNPGHELKLMTRFTGDLNIFTGAKAPEVSYKTRLQIINGGGSQNTAELSVAGDTGVTRVSATKNGQELVGLQGGTGMELHITVQPGYHATVEVFYHDDLDGDGVQEEVPWPFETVKDQSDYSFVTREGDMVVRVSFQPSDTKHFMAYLTDLPSPLKDDYAQGNETTVTSAGLRINSHDAAQPHPDDGHDEGPAGSATVGETVTVKVETHPDYQAVVYIWSFGAEAKITGLTAVGTDYQVDGNGNVTLPFGGTVRFTMPQSEVDVVVAYTPAVRRTATLEVWHEGLADDKIPGINTAQLAVLSYDAAGVGSTGYSGQVYEDTALDPNDHSALKDPGKLLPWIPATQASQSDSLGGDTNRTGAAWVAENDPIQGSRALMSLLWSSPSVSTFAGSITGLDLASVTVYDDTPAPGYQCAKCAQRYPDDTVPTCNQTCGGTVTETAGATPQYLCDLCGHAYTAAEKDAPCTQPCAGAVEAVPKAGVSYPKLKGLRKNLDGEPFGEEDLSQAASLLWELRAKILSDQSSGGLREQYVKEVRDGTGSTVLYTYLDLTPAQVQAYLMGVQEEEALSLNNLLAYRECFRLYQTALQIYEQVHAVETTQHATAPVAPIAPRAVKVDSAKGLRQYESAAYLDYVANYKTYLGKTAASGEAATGYLAYISALTEGGSGGVSAYGDKPDETPLDTSFVELPLLSPADAVAKVKTGTWGSGKAPGSAASLTARTGRAVSVVTEADSAYTVDKVKVIRADGRTEFATPITATRSGSYRNIYTFSMPAEDCVVQVYYKPRETRDLKWEIRSAGGLADNVSVISAYVADPGSTVPRVVTAGNGEDPTAKEGEIGSVLTQSVVSALVKVAEHYKVTVTATDGVGGRNLTVSSVPAPNPADGTVYTFTVPRDATGTGGPVCLTVTYAPDSQASHKAYLHTSYYGGTSSNGANSAVWSNGAAEITALSGEDLAGSVSLAPGYYIYSAYAVGASGSHPVSLDGNGYNNGLGAGLPSLPDGKRVPVSVGAVMPDEDLHVYLVYRQGLPSTQPGNSLTLMVQDEDNTSSPAADNWASAAVYSGGDTTAAPKATLKKVGLGASAQDPVTHIASTSVSHVGTVERGDAALAGDTVVVDFSAAESEGFYVSNVTVGPSSLGVSIQWLTPTSLQFTMPAGSTTVRVRFNKKAPTDPTVTYRVHALKTETDNQNQMVADHRANPGNNITHAISDTIKSYSDNNAYTLKNNINPEVVPDSTVGGRGAGRPGETVTMTFKAQRGWYVQSVVVITDGAARVAPFTLLSGSNDGSDDTVMTAQLVMPTGDAYFTVNYRQCPVDAGGEPIPKPDIETPERTLTLVVIDGDNPGTANNLVTATAACAAQGAHSPLSAGKRVAGAAAVGRGAVATEFVHAGDVIDLAATLDTGYAVDYAIINPASLGISPTRVGTGKARFTMPDADIVVVVNIVKGEPRAYIANLILRPPTGMTAKDLDKVGQGTFTTGGGTLENYAAGAVYSLRMATGSPVALDMLAFDGYYIRAVTVDPPMGCEITSSGSFRYQNASFVMPEADVNVNVWFERGWPDQVGHDLTLRVFDPANNRENYAGFASVGGAALAAPESDPVYANASRTLTARALDGQEVVVAYHRAPGFYLTGDTISVTDSSGAELDWRYVEGGIAFTMPPRHTTVTLSFLRAQEVGDVPVYPTYQARLHTTNYNDLLGNTAVLTGSTFVANNGSLTAQAGDVLKLKANLTTQPGALWHVSAAYAVDSEGSQVLLPMTLVSGGGEAAFAMPEADVDVYVTYEEGAVTPTAPLALHLALSGPADSGSAELASVKRPGETAQASLMTADALAASASLMGAQTELFTATLAPAEGYSLRALTVEDAYGNAVPYTWIARTENDDTEPSTWELTGELRLQVAMPAGGGTIHAVFEKIPTEPGEPDPEHPDDPVPDVPKTYTAQVVVNNEDYVGDLADSLNDAGFPETVTLPDSTTDTVLRRIRTAAPGTWVDLDIVVQTGYRVLPIVVQPASYGLRPQLYLGDLDSQSTGFFMPAGDVIVYVHFVPDNLTVYNATLVVAGTVAPGEKDDDGDNRDGNWATIHTLRTGTKGPITADDSPVGVRAAPVREWVTVDYDWDRVSCSVAEITVRDLAGRDVPFTQVNDNQITLPMVAKDILITVTFRGDDPDIDPDNPDPQPEPDPVLYPVVLHVIDASSDGRLTDNTDLGWGKLAYTPSSDVRGTAAETDRLPAWAKSSLGDDKWGNVDESTDPAADRTAQATIMVPAGEVVDLTAFSGAADGVQYYIQSAYVLYRAGGQMIECNFTPDDKETPARPGPGFTGDKASRFAVHPGTNDVYVVLTDKVPEKDKFTATLMLKGPEEDTNSTATIYLGDTFNNTPEEDRAAVRVNGDHAAVIAARKDTVKITVSPFEGYAIDYILLTPLGIPVTPTRVDNTYTFTMPGRNISACVYLKQGSEKQHEVRLHYSQEGTGAPAQNHVDLTWTPEGQVAQAISADRNTAAVDPGYTSMQVSENARVDLKVTLDSPYVVLAAFALQGGKMVKFADALEGKGESVSMTDNLLADAQTYFTMPAGDVDVYLVTTDEAPTISEEETWYTAVLSVQDPDNSGKNSAKIERDHLHDGALPDPGARTVSSTNMSYITVLPGQTVYITVTPPAAGYTFDRPATLTHSTLYNGALTANSYENPIQYSYTVGECNSTVLVNFKSADQKENDLTVVLEDPDNPGDGSTVNQVRVSKAAPTTEPTAPAVPLTVRSTAPAGAFQVIRGVPEEQDLLVTVTPQEGYRAYAYFRTESGETEGEPLPLTWNDAAGLYTAAFPMPAQSAQLTVTFYEAHTATLRLVDRNSTDPDSRATLEARMPVTRDFGEIRYQTFGPVEANQTEPQRTLDALRRDTQLTTRVQPQSTAVLTAVLLTEEGSTRFLSPDEEGAYRYTMGRADVEITVVVDSKPDGEHKPAFVAAVETVDRPLADPEPTLSVSPAPAVAGQGRIWASAYEGNTLTVSAEIQTGHRVTAEAIYTDPVGGGEIRVPVPLAASPDPAPNGAGWSVQTGTFTMPAANVRIVLTYVQPITLTLHIQAPAGLSTALTTSAAPAAGLDGQPTAPLTADGKSVLLAAGTEVAVSAHTNDATQGGLPVRVREIYYQTAEEVRWLYLAPTNMGPYQVDLKFTPTADADLTVVYETEYGEVEPPREYFTAWVTTVGDEGLTDNAVTSIQASTPGLPTATPQWACGMPWDEMSLSLTTREGWYAVVTAVDQSTLGPVPVIQQGYTGNCTAVFFMPWADVLVTVTYSQTPPTVDPEDVALRLVYHDSQAGNSATATDGTLSLVTDGLSGTHVIPGDLLSPVWQSTEDGDQKVTPGVELRLAANWAEGYRITRATLAVPQGATARAAGSLVTQPLAETELPLNRYASTAAARFNMPGEQAVITVYYENIYTATLNLVGSSHGLDAGTDPAGKGDQIGMTDDRTPPVTSTGESVVHKHTDQLLELVGGETVTTQAATFADSGRRLVGVVYESELTGARSPQPQSEGSDHFDFSMPRANTQVYAVFEPEPQEGETPSYIAKVELAEDSAPYGGENTVKIENTSDPTASHGSFWTAARAGETVTVTVSLQEGWQAQVIETRMDDTPVAGADFDFYVSRVRFVATGKTSTFTMPADTDATVVVRFIQGYDLTLSVTDATDQGRNRAETLAAASATLAGESGAGAAGNAAAPAVTADAVQGPEAGDYAARLSVDDQTGGAFAAVRVYPTGRPALFAAPGGEVSAPAGTEMTVSCLVPTGLKAEVSALSGGTPVPLTTVADGLYTFTMPDGDVTVTATVTQDATRTVPTSEPATPASDDATVTGLDKGLSVATALLSQDSGVKTTVLRETLFQGTQRLEPGAGDYAFALERNTQVSALFQSKNAKDNRLAKVELAGDGDIFGNTARPIWDYTDQVTVVDPATAPANLTSRGEVWTTTTDGHTVELTVTVAKGYLAKIKVRRDDSTVDDQGDPTPAEDWKYLKANAYGFTVNGEQTYTEPVEEISVGFKRNDADSVLGNFISGPQTFRFTMPETRAASGTEGAEDYVPGDTGTDVTVIVEFVYAGDIPAPYDPRNPKMEKIALEKGFIYAESRGDHAVVEIPTLFQDDVLYHTNSYGDADNEADWNQKKVTYTFYILDKSTGVYTPLDPSKDVRLSPYDPADAATYQEGDPYNYVTGMYTETKADSSQVEYVGSKLILSLAPQTGTTSSAQYTKLQKMLDSAGSLDGDNETLLYVQAVNAIGEASSYTPVWIRPCFSLAARVISYGPRHALQAELYPLESAPVGRDVGDGEWDMDLSNYASQPTFVDEVEPVAWGLDRWQQIVRVRSSELFGSFTADYDPASPSGGQSLTYAMVLRKTANLTYSRVAIQLDTTAQAAYYDPNTHTFSIQDVITLVAGDVDGDEAVKWQDQDMLMNYIYRNGKWSRRLSAPAPIDEATATAEEKAAYEQQLAEWEVSIYNPMSLPYRCDLNSDNTLSVADLNILTSRFNYNRTPEDYKWDTGRGDGTDSLVLPHGLGVIQGEAVLLSLEEWYEGQVEPDPFWDVPLTPQELESLLPYEEQPSASAPQETGAPQPSWDTESGERPERPSEDDDRPALPNVSDAPQVPEAPGGWEPALLPEPEEEKALDVPTLGEG